MAKMYYDRDANLELVVSSPTMWEAAQLAVEKAKR